MNTANLFLLINVGDVFGFSRLVLFFQEKPFSDICLDLPNTVGGAPKVLPCPRQARGLWDTHGGALAVSNRAVAAAAAIGHAVSGADVVTAAKFYHLTFRHTPTFLAGRGGVVEFTTPVVIDLNTKLRSTSACNCQRPLRHTGLGALLRLGSDVTGLLPNTGDFAGQRPKCRENEPSHFWHIA